MPPIETRGRSTRTLPTLLLTIAALLLAARVGFGIFGQVERPPHPDLVQWREPGDAVLAEARSTGKPLLYDFTAEWCGPCHAMQEEVFSDPTMAAKISSIYVPVRVLDREREEGRNPPEVEALERRYRVGVFPTLVVTSPDGTRQDRMEGYGGSMRTMPWISMAALKVMGIVPGSGAPPDSGR